jgi:hypothetical protein
MLALEFARHLSGSVLFRRQLARNSRDQHRDDDRADSRHRQYRRNPVNHKMANVVSIPVATMMPSVLRACSLRVGTRATWAMMSSRLLFHKGEVGPCLVRLPQCQDVFVWHRARYGRVRLLEDKSVDSPPAGDQLEQLRATYAALSAPNANRLTSHCIGADMKHSPYLDCPLFPLAETLPRLLEKIGTELTTAGPVQRALPPPTRAVDRRSTHAGNRRFLRELDGPPARIAFSRTGRSWRRRPRSGCDICRQTHDAASGVRRSGSQICSASFR